MGGSRFLRGRRAEEIDYPPGTLSNPRPIVSALCQIRVQRKSTPPSSPRGQSGSGDSSQRDGLLKSGTDVRTEEVARASRTWKHDRSTLASLGSQPVLRRAFANMGPWRHLRKWSLGRRSISALPSRWSSLKASTDERTASSSSQGHPGPTRHSLDGRSR